ncbi:uncharacterized protein LOC101856844 [Aplysia californica]|uniref:Uncharacterized protein LOC101856844 n=1 Tax=Aplysia californica TaxID=6500 RepID=A0ABM1W163_APLCA|nr:uncharacterized protein LOC101856844 [Aplysia californica]XP_035828406.1 uncharacterized protein LOC101856844 [Aplysia californica]
MMATRPTVTLKRFRGHSTLASLTKNSSSSGSSKCCSRSRSAVDDTCQTTRCPATRVLDMSTLPGRTSLLAAATRPIWSSSKQTDLMARGNTLPTASFSTLAGRKRHVGFKRNCSTYDLKNIPVSSDVRRKNSWMFDSKVQVSDNDPCSILRTAVQSAEKGHFFPQDYLPFFSQYQTCVYARLGLSHVHQMPLLGEPKIWLEPANNLNIKSFTIDSESFEMLSSLVVTNVDDIPSSHVPRLLHHLHYLLLSGSEMVKVLLKRSEQLVHLFDLQDLAFLASSGVSHHMEAEDVRKLVDRTKELLDTQNVKDVNVGDLCVIYGNLQSHMTTPMFDLGARIISGKLSCEELDPTVNIFGTVEMFNKLSKFECVESLDNSIFMTLDRKNLSPMSFGETDLDTFGHAGKLFRRVDWIKGSALVKEFMADIVKDVEGCADVGDVVRVSSLLDREHLLGQEENFAQNICELVKDTDFVMFSKLLKICLRLNILFRNRSAWDLSSELQQRLEKMSEVLTVGQLEELLWADGGSFARAVWRLLDYRAARGCYWSTDFRRHLEQRLTHKVDQPEARREEVRLFLTLAVNRLTSGLQISPVELSALTQSMQKLDFGDLLAFHRTMVAGFRSSLPGNVKKQIQQLKVRLCSVFSHKLQQARGVSPEFSLFTGRQQVGSGPASGVGERWSLYEELLKELPQLVASSSADEKSCLRAVTLLNKLSEFHFAEAETLETLFCVVRSRTEENFLASLQLLEVMAKSGYQPRQFEKFVAWSHQLASDVMRSTCLSKTKQVEIALYLSMVEVFPDDVLQKIFSLDFLLSLEKELAESSKSQRESALGNLALLNRSICLECPHVNLTWFCHKHLPAGLSGSDDLKFLSDRLMSSLCRVFGAESFVKTSQHSPYGHHIDFLLMFDSNGLPVIPSDNLRNDYEKVAVQLLSSSDFCQDSGQLTGHTLVDIRHLQILGYSVVTIPQHRLSSMDVQSDEALDQEVWSTVQFSVAFTPVSGTFVPTPDEGDR